MEIYLDNAATTKVYDSVAKEVKEFFLVEYGNASSQHPIGINARNKLEEARKKIADYVGAEPSEIIFTSGGTESDNLALRGLAKANPEKKHIITSVIEHPAIIETCKDLEKQGYKVDYVNASKDGIVSVEDVINKTSEDTLVVSIMHVNNEIGTIQPIEEIAKSCKEKNIYFHTDAVQGFTKVDLDLTDVDLMSVSGHKVHAPKGIGFLYIKKGTKIAAIMTGGGQECNLRSGTENVPGIIGLAAALEEKENVEGIRESRDKIIVMLKEIPGTRFNGSLESRVYNNINVSFYGIEGESLMLMLNGEGIFVSTGSACASTKLSESHVLNALGIDVLYVHGSLRLTLGSDAIGNEDYIAQKIKKKVERLREISPFKLNLKEVKDE
ncbi:cysteine desulfurase [Candidatus Pacearchaeota archaeon]|nr:cysteine desulfurase [Candidatus Pacearchaeota archaeon]